MNTREFYRDKLQHHPDSPRDQVGWSQYGALVRYELTARLLSKDAQVLDVGCGPGGFLHYCLERGLQINYRGIDLLPEFVTACGAVAGSDRVAVCDLFGELPSTWPRGYDWVVGLGIFCTMPDQDAILAALERMYDLCDRAVVASILHCDSHRHTPGLTYVEPYSLLRAVRRITPLVTAQFGYCDQDLFLVLFKDPLAMLKQLDLATLYCSADHPPLQP